MSILRLVRNFALLAVLALAAHAAAGADKGGSGAHECFGQNCSSSSCGGGCACSATFGCVPKRACDTFGDCLPKH